MNSDIHKKIVNVVHMDGYKCKWWEHLLLPLVEFERWSGEESVMRFKRLFNRMYIYELKYYKRKYDNAMGKFN